MGPIKVDFDREGGQSLPLSGHEINFTKLDYFQNMGLQFPGKDLLQ